MANPPFTKPPLCELPKEEAAAADSPEAIWPPAMYTFIVIELIRYASCHVYAYMMLMSYMRLVQ